MGVLLQVVAIIVILFFMLNTRNPSVRPWVRWVGLALFALYALSKLRRLG